MLVKKIDENKKKRNYFSFIFLVCFFRYFNFQIGIKKTEVIMTNSKYVKAP
jgi:hypothetical protein